MALLLCGVFGGVGSDDGLGGSAWIWREFECGLDMVLARVWSACFADMDVSSVASLEGGGDADLGGEGVAECFPGIGDVVGLELQSDGVDGAIGEDADEQMAFDAALDLMIDGPQTEIGFERAEDGFEVREH